jgi:cytosine/adenosine deaminase-related metal-dependent hydrolase
MATLLFHHADVLVTMDDARREIADGGVFARDGVIEAVGPSDKLPTDADEVINAHGQLVMPGLVNTHHHMFQTLTRALPAAQDAELFAWLRALYPIWAGLTPEMLHTSTQTPFSVSRELMRESAALARQYGVSLHTHLAENDNDIAYTREKFGCTPAEYAESLGWIGRDVWCAHCVKLDDAGIRLFARTGTGVAHCPCSNTRLASGIAPIRKMRDAGVPVAIAVDGSASNDSSHMFGELRMAMLLQRVAHGPAALTARDVLEMATRGGAQVLNRDDIGHLAPGMSADLITVPLGDIGIAGALHDPVAALVFCHVPRVRHSIVNGRVVVRDGELATLDLPRLIERHNRLARELVDS